MNPAIDEIEWHPAVKIAARVLAVPAGLAGSLFAAVIAFMMFELRGCDDPIEEGSTSYICDHFATALAWVEFPLVFVAILAPFCGGIASCITGKARWVGIGVATCALTCVLMGMLGGELLQTESFG